MEALQQAKISNPSARWWIKADACDVRVGLRESMRGEWSGDEDLGSGDLQTLYADYKSRCLFVRSMMLKMEHFLKLKSALEGDITFLSKGKRESKEIYDNALRCPGKMEQTLMVLAWNVTGYEELLKQAKEFEQELLQSIACLQAGDKTKFKNWLMPLKTKLSQYLHGLFSKKRSAASHLLIFMISDELRNRKPYAIPVRFLPYKGITDCKLRDLQLELETTMNSLHMDVVG